MENKVVTAVPPFVLGKPRYDQSTYWGRVRHFFDYVDPRMMFVSTERLDASQSLLRDFAAGRQPASTTDAELWQAQKVVNAVIHPDTGEPIFMLGRMCAFGPVNIPICYGMVVAAPTMFNTVFWQAMNQTYNAGLNYANRNATVPTDYKLLAGSYGLAVSVAVGTAVGLRRWVGGLTHVSPFTLKLLQTFTPFVAVATAGVFNVGAMRYREGIEGIDVCDDTGKSYGKSVTAGQTSLLQVAATRFVLPIPVILGPPAIYKLVESLLPRMVVAMNGLPRVKLAYELFVVFISLVCGLPLAIGIFPQVSEIQASKLEPKFWNLTNSKGDLIESFYFNKGL